MKKQLGMITAAAIIFAAVSWTNAGVLLASSPTSEIAVVLNGQVMVFDTPPVERDGYAFFPLEDLLAGIGVSHGWNGWTYTVQGILGDGIIEIPLSDPCYIVNGTRLDVPDYLLPFVENQRTYVYLDYVVQAFGLEVMWDGAAKTITLLIPVESLELDVSSLTINRGESLALTPTIYPYNASDKRVFYASGNIAVATVSESGVITAVGAGTTDIVCYSINDKTARCAVTVVVPVEKVFVDLPRSVYKIGEEATFTVTVYPSDATDKSVVVDVVGAAVTPGGDVFCATGGVVTVMATASNGVTDTREVTVIDLDEYAAEVIRLTNIERTNRGLQPLTSAANLTAAALVRTKELLTLVAHERPDGRSCFTALDEAGRDYQSAGENLASGYKTPQEVVDGWMNSDGHRRNILNGTYDYIGVGVEMDGNGRLYWLQMFTD